jgi:hypothetical protein
MKTRVFAVCVVLFLFCGITHAGLSDGLVAYYPFNGNANDESGNGNNGTVNGATLTTDRFDNANKAYSFNGSNNYIQITNGTPFNFTNDLSLSFWINAGSPQQEYMSVIDKTHAGGPVGVTRAFVVQQSSYDLNHIRFSWGDGTNWSVPLVLSGINLQTNNWQYITITKHDLEVKYYINGIFVYEYTSPSASASIFPNSNLPLTFGACYWSDAKTYVRFFNGKLDDVRIYNRALSASEVQQLYQGQGTCSSEVVKFTAGTPAKAADVNANFDALNCQIQLLNSQLQALKAIVCKNEPTASVCQ